MEFWTLLSLLLQIWQPSTPKVPALFIFGASLVDSGNNNDLPVIAKSNFHPYGVDFPGGTATGRFSNGYLVPDYIATYLGLPLVPPYRSHPGNFEQGVNFAESGCGIYNTTGEIYEFYPSPEYPAPLPAQVRSFQEVKETLVAEKGSATVLRDISRSIFYIATGDNDIGNGYYGSGSDLPQKYSISEFIDLLVSIFASQIEALYYEGARKFVVVSLRPTGCGPRILVEHNVTDNGECYNLFNVAAKKFNTKLQVALENLRSSLENVQLLYADFYNYVFDRVQNPESYGLKVSNVGCCDFIGAHKNTKATRCTLNAPYCDDRSSYLYWDHVHFTTQTYKHVADLYWSGSAPHIYPMNIAELAAS